MQLKKVRIAWWVSGVVFGVLVVGYILLVSWYGFMRYAPIWVTNQTYVKVSKLAENQIFNTAYVNLLAGPVSRFAPSQAVNMLVPGNVNARPYLKDAEVPDAMVIDGTFTKLETTGAKDIYRLTLRSETGQEAMFYFNVNNSVYIDQVKVKPEKGWVQLIGGDNDMQKLVQESMGKKMRVVYYSENNKNVYMLILLTSDWQI